MKIQQILSNVSKKITPLLKEKILLDKSLLEFEKKLRPKLKKYQAKLFVGGSLAKQTLVKRDTKYDIDIFIMFPYARYKNKSKELSRYLEQVIRASKLKHIRLKGSRDYFQVKYKNLKLELIPILAIKKPSQALNITDISPLHVTYILKQIKKNKKLANEIRLAKAFCYGTDCYGAESYIRGFSGYALEVLVSYYGSFVNFIRAASKWKIPISKESRIVVDPKKYYKSKNQVFKELNEAKLHSPIILIDPVQKERNAAAALSFKTFTRFIKACKDFLKTPNEKFFFKEAFDINAWKKKARKDKARFVALKTISTKKKVDIAGAKLKKFYEFLFFYMKKNGFKILSGTFDFDEKSLISKFYFILKEPEKYYVVAGPPTNIDVKYLKAFKKKWKKAFVKKERLYAKAKRKISTIRELVKTIPRSQLKDMGIKEIKSL
ncbi:MAG: hypothetical protein IB618_00995 [Candidatus Pacearchaeota archaeon]|nr:MAG: hypothetical protein IB618_00995 [Candidatus Pacearchaeota archaeon]